MKNRFGMFGGLILFTCILATSQSYSQSSSAILTDGHYTMMVESDYESAVTFLKEAIVNRGLAIDYQGHIGDMLERTENSVGAISPYLFADYFQFCSAPLSHAVLAASSNNLAVCPYVVFAYETKAKPGFVTLGYRRPMRAQDEASVKPIANIEKLLQAIVDEAGE